VAPVTVAIRAADGACSAEEELASMNAEWTKRFEHLTNVK
jgi:hypothetical protein